MKIGIYGGTFDPPHNGHVHACKSFYNAFELDKLLVIPTSIPPHKARTTSVSGWDRMEMARLAFSNIGEKIEISDVELKRKGKSYTRDTIKYFLENGVDEILLLCGTDMFVTFDTWYDFTYIFKNATIVCIRRENNLDSEELIKQKTVEYKQKYGAKIEFLDVHPVELSSTDIRAEINGAYIPKLVYDYIVKRGLYGE